MVAGIDTKNGRIAVKGWKAQVALTPDEAIPQLEAHVAAFLYTHVDGEGLMQGFPIDTAARLRRLTARQLIVAGGIRSQQEIDELDAHGRGRGGGNGGLHESACSLIFECRQSSASHILRRCFKHRIF